MQVKFNSPVSIDGVDFRPGIQQVPDKLANHWYLLALIQNGVAFVVEEPKSEAEAGPQAGGNGETYQQYMSDWESKADKKAEGKLTANKKRKSRAKPKPEVQPEGT